LALCERQFQAITNLNLPGAIIGAPLTAPAIAFLGKQGEPFGMEICHTLTLPFFCVPVWWLIGRNLDRFLTARGFDCGSWIDSLSCLRGTFIALLTASPLDRRDLLIYLPV
jgi:predicted membrane protein